MIPNFQNSSKQILGSSLLFSAQGGWGKEQYCGTQNPNSENWRYLLDEIRTFFDENPDFDF